MSLQQVILLQVWFAVVLNLAGLPSIHCVAIGERDVHNVHSRVRRTTGSIFTAEEAQDIVDTHNEFRSQANPEPANMLFMNWDYPLADMAQQYAELCIWDHGQVKNNTSSFKRPGQNLRLSTGRPDRFISGVASVNSWHKEVRNYNYTNRHCTPGKVCNHYRQVVWAETYAVGCGQHFCETAVEPSVPNSAPWKNVWIIVCNYGPRGNLYNRAPYVAGPSCTQCPSGSEQCYNGLCRETSD